jgi:hypothetical protein
LALRSPRDAVDALFFPGTPLLVIDNTHHKFKELNEFSCLDSATLSKLAAFSVSPKCVLDAVDLQAQVLSRWAIPSRHSEFCVYYSQHVQHHWHGWFYGPTVTPMLCCLLLWLHSHRSSRLNKSLETLIEELHEQVRCLSAVPVSCCKIIPGVSQREHDIRAMKRQLEEEFEREIAKV